MVGAFAQSGKRLPSFTRRGAVSISRCNSPTGRQPALKPSRQTSRQQCRSLPDGHIGTKGTWSAGQNRHNRCPAPSDAVVIDPKRLGRTVGPERLPYLVVYRSNEPPDLASA